MSKKDRPPLAGLSGDDDLARIRAYGLSRGFIPTETTQPPPAASVAASPVVVPAAPVEPPPPVPTPAAAPAMVVRPAPTKPWQAMFPDYLIEELRNAAAREGTAQKVIVMRALRAAGFRVDDIDLQDLRRR
ncbi:hypothetical protein [Azospirillum soli]|uniref:hypothetical protein n=1 Tax=Azospirillum soli TaxID=1304799 RepID=UPI001AE9B670|nr:hypothetical protein [Azospirillum soli]MBP2316086.1 hypothetical protein [Azospirillum soli]